MKFFKLPSSLVFFSFLLFFLCIPMNEAAPQLRATHWSVASNFTPNSTNQSNLNLLLSSLTSNATVDSGFFNDTTGDVEIIYGIFLCRADVPPLVCQECSATAVQELKRCCPTSKVATIWYDACMVRYSNESIFSTLTELPEFTLQNTENVTDPVRFSQFVSDIMNRLSTEAAQTPSVKKFAATEENFTSNLTVYNFVQCTPDLTTLDCNSCIRQGISILFTKYPLGGSVLTPSCSIRNEPYPFYNVTAAREESQLPPSPPSPPPTPSPLPSLPPQPSAGNRKISAVTIIAIVVPVLVSLLFLSICFCILRRRRAKGRAYKFVMEDNVGDEMSAIGSLQFDFATIEAATNKFSYDNKIGEGGFGAVYKGENNFKFIVPNFEKTQKSVFQWRQRKPLFSFVFIHLSYLTRLI